MIDCSAELWCSARASSRSTARSADSATVTLRQELCYDALDPGSVPPPCFICPYTQTPSDITFGYRFAPDCQTLYLFDGYNLAYVAQADPSPAPAALSAGAIVGITAAVCTLAFLGLVIMGLLLARQRRLTPASLYASLPDPANPPPPGSSELLGTGAAAGRAAGGGVGRSRSGTSAGGSIYGAVGAIGGGVPVAPQFADTTGVNDLYSDSDESLFADDRSQVPSEVPPGDDRRGLRSGHPALHAGQVLGVSA